VENSQATFEAYDGVKLVLGGGRVVECAPLSVAEATRLLRQLTPEEGDPDHASFIAEFPERLGIMDELLADLVEVEGVGGEPLELGELTLRDGFDMATLWGVSVAPPDIDAEASAKAQLRVLDEFPATFGLAVDLPAAEVFAVARRLTEAIYLRIYGLAARFSESLTGRPTGQVIDVNRLSSSSSAPPRASTT
jgi:hypothetical protein